MGGGGYMYRERGGRGRNDGDRKDAVMNVM